MLNCTPCTFNNSSLKVLGVAGHMSAHCRAGFSVPFIGSVHDVKFSYWLQLLECYIKMYNQNGCDCICLSSYTPYYALNLQKKEVAVAIFAKLKLCRHRRPATHTSCSEKLIESGQLIKGHSKMRTLPTTYACLFSDLWIMARLLQERSTSEMESKMVSRWKYVAGLVLLSLMIDKVCTFFTSF